MFKKKPNVKALAPLRSSDRRKLADQIIKDYGIPIPPEEPVSAENNGADGKQPQPATPTTNPALVALRNALLPDNSLSARFTTTHGPDLKQASGTVYAGHREGEELRILWVKVGERAYPTVYTLWNNPGIVPLLHTHAPVIAKLQSGADLMVPGLDNGPPFPAGAKKGAVVAIGNSDNPSVPLIVGTCVMDVSALGRVQGAKGVAVETVSWYGDELWSWSSGGRPGGSAPNMIEGWLPGDGSGESGNTGKLTDSVHALSLARVENSHDGELNEDSSQSKGTQIAREESEEEEYSDEVEKPKGKEWTTKEIDDAFRNAFFYGIYKQKQNHEPPHFGLDFPLRQSFVMSNLVQPFLPVFTPSDAAALQVKKTSWKNIRKFIKALDKDVIVKAKERDNEAIIIDIDFDDQAILRFEPYRLPKKANPSADTSSTPKSSQGETDPSGDPSLGQTIKIAMLFKAKEIHAPLFVSHAGKPPPNPRGFYSPVDLRALVTNFCESEQLFNQTNKRLVNLNAFLSNAIFDGSRNSDAEIVKSGSVTREALFERVQNAFSSHHAILRNGATLADTGIKPRAGQPPRITITLETRTGNKTVTKVSGLEPYYILAQPLADELRKVCAGSTSVERLAGSSPSAKVQTMEVMVQGPQKDAVLKALGRRGVDKKLVDVVDRTKKKKK